MPLLGGPQPSVGCRGLCFCACAQCLASLASGPRGVVGLLSCPWRSSDGPCRLLGRHVLEVGGPESAHFPHPVAWCRTLGLERVLSLVGLTSVQRGHCTRGASLSLVQGRPAGSAEGSARGDDPVPGMEGEAWALPGRLGEGLMSRPPALATGGQERTLVLARGASPSPADGTGVPGTQHHAHPVTVVVKYFSAHAVFTSPR